jgi:hypothetical protein
MLMIGVACGFPKHLPAITAFGEMLKKNKRPDGAWIKNVGVLIG